MTTELSDLIKLVDVMGFDGSSGWLIDHLHDGFDSIQFDVGDCTPRAKRGRQGGVIQVDGQCE